MFCYRTSGPMTGFSVLVQMERNLARHMLLEVKQSVAADEMARAHSLQELKASLMRDKSASEVSRHCSK